MLKKTTWSLIGIVSTSSQSKDQSLPASQTGPGRWSPDSFHHPGNKETEMFLPPNAYTRWRTHPGPNTESSIGPGVYCEKRENARQKDFVSWPVRQSWRVHQSCASCPSVPGTIKFEPKEAGLASRTLYNLEDFLQCFGNNPCFETNSVSTGECNLHFIIV